MCIRDSGGRYVFLPDPDARRRIPAGPGFIHRAGKFQGLSLIHICGCALTIYPTSQKHYETICEMEGCRLERYTDGSRTNSQETVLHLSCGARMENVNRKNVDFAPLKFLLTESLEAGLEKAAEEIGRNMSARLFMPPAYHWCSWYYCYQNFDQLQLTEYLNGLAGMEKRPDIKYFQLDVGYCTSIGD